MIKVRKAKLKDIPKMVNIWLELVNYHIKLDHFYYEINKQAVKSYKKWIRKNIIGKNSIYLVTEENEEIVGHIGGTIQKRPPCFKIEKNGFIEELIITKKYRNKGIGKNLTNELLKWFKSKNIKFVELRASSKNKQGILAWNKIGFKENLKIMIKKL